MSTLSTNIPDHVASKPRRRTALLWSFERRDDFVHVTMKGEIDENASLGELARRLEGKVKLDLAEIRRINSAGVREWVNFIRNLPRVESISLVRCSPTITNQLNMIFNFRGKAMVESFYAPYLCEHCDLEIDVLVEVNKHFPDRDPSKVPSFSCERCGAELTFDDIPERYFSFILQL